MSSARSYTAALAFWFALALTLVLALLPHPPQMPAVHDKVQHAFAFAVLTILLSVAFERTSFAWRFAILTGIGGIVELLQLLPVFHRDSEWSDWWADCVSSLIVLIFLEVMRRRKGVLRINSRS